MERARPSIGTSNKIIKNHPDTCWIDSRGRIIGKLHEIDEEDTHVWILLPKITQEIAIAFPIPQSIIPLYPYARSEEQTTRPEFSMIVKRYVIRPRRQRAAGLIVSFIAPLAQE